MDSGVSILNLSTSRKVLSLLSLLMDSTLVRLGYKKQVTIKPERFRFSTLSIAFFDIRDWIQEVRACSFEGPCNLIESVEL